VAPRIGGHGVLGPLPVLERRRVELELARRRGEAGAELAVDENADSRPLFAATRVTGSTDAPRAPPPTAASVRAVDVVGDQEGAVLPHVRERGSAPAPCASQTGHAVFEDPPVELSTRSSRRTGTATRSICGCRGPVGSMRHESSIQNSSSSHTCPSPAPRAPPGRVEDLALALEGTRSTAGGIRSSAPRASPGS